MSKTYTHLTLDDRITIQILTDNGKEFTDRLFASRARVPRVSMHSISSVPNWA